MSSRGVGRDNPYVHNSYRSVPESQINQEKEKTSAAWERLTGQPLRERQTPPGYEVTSASVDNERFSYERRQNLSANEKKFEEECAISDYKEVRIKNQVGSKYS